jgi:alpha-amylase/alpha-mannosidase (GH57 family)
MRGKKLYLVILWHMHQPLYINPKSKTFELPWTLLHSIKDYLDMLKFAERFDIKVNFNLTPVLLEQIEKYPEVIDGKSEIKCRLIEIIKNQHSGQDSDFLKSLLKSLSPLLSAKVRDKITKAKSERDIAVIYTLSWCGNILSESKIIKALEEKENNFGEDEIASFLKEIKKHISKIIPSYKKAKDSEKIGISTSPYYHPITPLLLDIQSAREAVPNINLPSIDRFLFEKDAVLHIKKAVVKFENIFGKKPFSFWPSEGAVSNKFLEVASEFIKVVATDEKIFFNSTKEQRREKIYSRFVFRDRIFALFRDSHLSDLISFSYHSWDQKKAVDDFISHLKRIYDSVDFSPIVSVILDGENCWEYYPENGKIFLENLYSTIEKEKWIETVKLDEIEYLENNPIIFIDYVKAGSWIDGTFLKWIGNEKKNRYWEELAKAKMKKGYETESILPAEGSDWFWWQGENENMEFIETFDKLFRSFLI